MNNQILLLMTAFLLKHFFADFPLQTVYMLGKGKKGLEWIMPLAAHCLVHALFTAIIITIYDYDFVWLAGLEFVIHFIVDRVKATQRLPQGPWNDQERGKLLSKYYFFFGLDQLAHGLTYIGLIYIMVN